jgi:uncharacterized protein YcbK (DUF882 family)
MKVTSKKIICNLLGVVGDAGMLQPTALPMLSRRRLLTFAAAAGAAPLLPFSPVEAALHGKAERLVALHNIHTGESLHTAYWVEGRYQPAALRAVNHLLRDHYSGSIHSMDPRVIDLICALQHRMASKRPFEVISGYRSPGTNAWLAARSDGVAQHSLHMEGKAIDIRLAGTSISNLGHAARSLRAGGVGQYPDSGFVHVDCGRVRHW